MYFRLGFCSIQIQKKWNLGVFFKAHTFGKSFSNGTKNLQILWQPHRGSWSWQPKSSVPVLSNPSPLMGAVTSLVPYWCEL